MRLPRFLLLLVPVGPLVVGFGGCGVSAIDGFSTSGTGTVSSSVSGSSSSGAIGTGGAIGGLLAAPCAGPSDCGGDLECLGPGTADPIFGGGAPGGFCTKACSADADCAGDGGICYQIDPTLPGRCTLACSFGPPITGVPGLFTPLSGAKCRGRDDLRCAKDTATTGACLPTCGVDAQCGGGYCDPRTAVCVSTPSTGAPTGAACDSTQMPGVCAGLCVGFQTGVAMCSEPCVLGGASLQATDCGGPEQGLCAFHPPANGAGDTGFCTPACTAQSDCQLPYFWCFGVPGLTETVHKGYCFAATPCPDGPSDCAASPDAGVPDGGGDAGIDSSAYTCVSTSAGPLCLDPAYPLPEGDGGAGDGGDADASDDAGTMDGGEADAGEADAGDAGDAGL